MSRQQTRSRTRLYSIFFGKYGEIARVLKHLNGSADSTALKLYELHKRHAKYVTNVVDDAISQNRSADPQTAVT